MGGVGAESAGAPSGANGRRGLDTHGRVPMNRDLPWAKGLGPEWGRHIDDTSQSGPTISECEAKGAWGTDGLAIPRKAMGLLGSSGTVSEPFGPGLS